MAKRIVRSAIKIVAAIAALVFVIVPTHEFNQLLFFVGSMVVLLVCLLLWLLLFGDEDTGWWPDKPEQ
jgi:Mn2+/Fe2+ NRAMP family transporter